MNPIHLFLLALILWTGSIYASGEEDNNSQNLQLKEPQITAESLDPPSQIRVWNNFRVNVSIKNNTDSAGLAINSINIVPSPLVCLELHKVGDEDTKHATIPLGGRLEFSYIFKPCKLSQYLENFFGILFYTPHSEKFDVQVNYTSFSESGSPSRNATPISLSVKFGASKLSIFFGAILGAFCSSFFIVLYDERQRRQSSPPLQQTFWHLNLSKEGFFRTLRGTFTLTILIPLLFVTSDIKLPISIAIEDFWGGFALGLFADKLAVTLYEKLTRS